MNDANYGHHGNEGRGRATGEDDVTRDHGPYWKRAHHDRRFWIGLVSMLLAITIYVLSDDLAFLPRR